MITYLYKCAECLHTAEVKQRITEDKLTVCLQCNKPSFERVPVNAPGVIFKGGNWFNNGGY